MFREDEQGGVSFTLLFVSKRVSARARAVTPQPAAAFQRAFFSPLNARKAPETFVQNVLALHIT
jgi:hypothetical protein